jgi:SPOR domain
MIHSKTILKCISGFVVIFSLGCGSSTGSRYKDGTTETSGNKHEKILREDIDISKYKTRIDFGDNSRQINKGVFSAWYDYPLKIDTSTAPPIIVNTVNGYRVRVLSTEDLNEADSLRNELFVKTNQKQIYIIFDPPFYRIEIGDFADISSARYLRFKLNQIGYNEARVVSEKVNVYK